MSFRRIKWPFSFLSREFWSWFLPLRPVIRIRKNQRKLMRRPSRASADGEQRRGAALCRAPRSLREPSPLLCAHADRACLAAAQVPSPSQLARTPGTGPTSVAQSIVLAALGLWCNCGLCSSVRLLLQVLAVARGILDLHCCSEIFSWSSGI